ncbi:MAG: hypothetical protein RML57_06035 [Acidobacteriota bacterium]|nr:hypothetical protein [Acidobacteriota bacterium]
MKSLSILAAALLLTTLSALTPGVDAQKRGDRPSASRLGASKKRVRQPSAPPAAAAEAAEEDDEETVTFRGARPLDNPRPRPGKPKPPMYRKRPNPAASVPALPAGTTAWLRETVERNLLGVTLWKLRPFRDGDDETVALEVTVNGRRERRTPVRAALSEPLRPGELVRLTLETEREGYVYVLNYELRRGGRLGPPTLLYPRPGETLFVKGGQLVELPPRELRAPYFEIAATGGEDEYAGEVLVLVTASRPLGEEVWRVTREGRLNVIRNVEFAAGLLGQGLQAALYEGTRLLGAVETAAEERAGRDRNFTLGEDDPPPQTVLSNRVTEAQPGRERVRLFVTVAVVGKK